MQALLFAWWIGVAADSQENPFGRDPTIVLQSCQQQEEGPIPQGLRHLGFWDPPLLPQNRPRDCAVQKEEACTGGSHSLTGRPARAHG